MKTRSNKPRSETTQPVNFRLDETLTGRFEKVAKVSRRTKTSIMEECLEVMLPKLEERYAALAKAA